MAVTIKQLSARCGLSVSTVSKALNGYTDVSEETRELVLAAAQELGYRPNAIARGLKLGRTFTIGVLYECNDGGFTHNFFSPVLQAFKEEVERRGYDILFVTRNMGKGSMSYLEHCRYRNLDGVCIVCTEFERDGVRELVASDLPVVTIDHVFNNRTCILSENRQGMEELTRHAIEMGHRRIAYVHGNPSAVTQIRLTSFLRTMAQAGLTVPPEYIVPSIYHNPAAAREATLRLLSVTPRPTCILMPDDYASLGGSQAIASAGLRIPQDISIAGYDGVELIQLCQPRLTTIGQDTARIGQEAGRQLVHLIERPQMTFPEIIKIPCRLIEGDTIARLADSPSDRL